MAKKRKPSQSRSSRAGLVMPVSKMNRHLRTKQGASRVGACAPVYLAAVLECVVSNVWESAANVTIADKRKRITAHDVMLAVRNDENMSKLFAGCAVWDPETVTEVRKAIMLPEDIARNKAAVVA